MFLFVLGSPNDSLYEEAWRKREEVQVKFSGPAAGKCCPIQTLPLAAGLNEACCGGVNVIEIFFFFGTLFSLDLVTLFFMTAFPPNGEAAK